MVAAKETWTISAPKQSARNVALEEESKLAQGAVQFGPIILLGDASQIAEGIGMAELTANAQLCSDRVQTNASTTPTQRHYKAAVYEDIVYPLWALKSYYTLHTFYLAKGICIRLLKRTPDPTRSMRSLIYLHCINVTLLL